MSDNKNSSGSLFVLAAVGAAALGAIAAAAAYKYLVPDHIDEFDNDFEDSFDEDDFFEEDEAAEESADIPAEIEAESKAPLEKGFAEDHMFEEE